MDQAIRLRLSGRLVEVVQNLAQSCSNRIGALPPEDYVASFLDARHHLRVIAAMGQTFRTESKHSVLEIGSGMGMKCLLGNALWGARFTGVEPCEGTYSSMREAILELKATNRHLSYEWVDRHGETTGLPSDSFDLAISFEAIEHVQDPRLAIEEIHRLLKPGSSVFISTCNYHSFYEGHYEIGWLPILCHSGRARHWWVRAHGLNPEFLREINCITRTQLVAHLRDAGFSNILFGYSCESASLPPLRLETPPSFRAGTRTRGRTALRELVENRHVHGVLRRFGLEYKLYVRAQKVPSCR